MSKINVLDKSVYNRISAGEVVENPASVVKELVENSIDAGADSIRIDIESGGIKSITVTDNGCGMEKEDLRLAILPHATSKIKSAADLETVGTLGFRGEALASVAAVSEVTIKSKYCEAETGNYIAVKGGEVVEENVCGVSVGTQISVRSLFFNTPARYKFLKNSKGEENNVTSLVAELIFANPTIDFSYTADGNVIYKTYGDGLKDGIYSVYGADIADNMIPLEFDENGYKIHGYTARPATEAIKNNRNKQTFIVNGRVIDDLTISAVIQNAYGEFLMKRTFPSVVLDIIMPFDSVDVNVHPNKREVRFADAKKINGIIYHCVKNAVEKDAEERQKMIFSMFHNIESEKRANKPQEIKEPVFTVMAEEDGYLPNEGHMLKANKPENVNIHQTFPLFGSSNVSKPTDAKLVFADYTKNIVKSNEETTVDTVLEAEETKAYKIIGQLFDTYLLLEIDDKIIFLDQHAAHERILFDKLIATAKQELAVQSLLLPYAYRIEDDEEEFFADNAKNFAKLGFETYISDNTIYVNTVPAMLTSMDIGAFLREVSMYKTELKELTDSALIKDKIAKYACKNAIKGGAALTESQISRVVDYFFENGVPLQCPHGRPTMISFTKSEIEKFFGRKV